MADRFITGFHSVEEKIRTIASEKNKKGEVTLYYSSVGPRVKKILVQAQNAGISCEQKEKSVLDSYVADLSKTAQDHRGLVLKVSGIGQGPSNLVDFYQWIEQVPQESTVLLLDSVTDPHNVGAIIRSCAAFGALALVVQDKNSPAESGAMIKASAGTIELLPVCRVTNLSRAIDLLKQADFWVAGMDGYAEVTLDKLNKKGNIALVMGSEGKGMRRLVEENCDQTVKLPIDPRVESLNVSTAAAIALYELSRK